MYRKLNDHGLKANEDIQRQYWDEIDLLGRTMHDDGSRPHFIFYEGPPTANGKPGLHHVISRTLKDAICRYKYMQGYYVHRKAGWDTHGLPVEIEVEKKLGLSSKKDIEAYGIEEFNKKCRESVFEYEAIWRDMTEQMAYLVDMDNPYITLENDYIESGWAILKKVFDDGLIYEGHKILPYCSRCGTGLASHEVAQGYKMVKQDTVTVAFKRKDKEEYFLVWTTTPWTLASNVALTVHPEYTYARIKQGEHIYIMAKALIGDVMGEDVEILEEFAGKELEGIEYEQIMPFVEAKGKAFIVTLADYVTLEDGTGIVHTAPAFGEEDYHTGRRYGLPVLQPVNEEGKFTATPWQGQFVMDADAQIVDWLRQEQKLYKKQRMEHNYPHCWRCHTPLLYYANPSYYIEMTKLRDQLLANNDTVNWYPDFIGEKRFGNWLENIKDWAISRNRYWGTPLNIWTCQHCGHKESIGSIQELKDKAIEKFDEIELHRPYVDDIHLTCPDCSNTMKRVPYVVDVWFDSGAMPFAQMHYPFEHKDDFDQYFPADYICEGIDQTRGWFYSLMAVSTLMKGVAPYKNVLVNDMLLDKDGKKMSKHIGNTINPFDLFQDYGADSVRWYLNVSSPAWQPTKFDIGGLRETLSKYFGTLKNVYNLFRLYANNDGIDATGFYVPLEDRSELDRWVISRLNQVITDVSEAYDHYDLTLATRQIQDFLNDEFSNWYIRRSRRRYWKEEFDTDKQSVYNTTYEVLLALVKLSAPIAPYITEEIYRSLTGEESVHLSDFPKADPSLINPELNRRMKLAHTIVTMGRAARETVGIKVRQPLSQALVDQRWESTLSGLEPIIQEELNIKQLRYTDDLTTYMNFRLKPNFPVLGPILGKNMGAFQKELKQVDSNQIGLKLRNHETVEIAGLEVSSNEVEVLVEAKENFTIQTQEDLFVILDHQLDEELIKEGYAREFVSNVQQMRRAKDFEVADHITIKYQSTPAFEAAIEEHRDFIMGELLADEMEPAELMIEEVRLNDQPTKIEIERVDD